MSGGVLLLTPTWGGDDGLSVLAGQYGSALHELSGGALSVWALEARGTERPRGVADDAVRVFDGGRASLGRAAIRSALRSPAHRVVIALHVNQLAVAAPLVLGDVPLVHVLVGIEAWKPIRGIRAAVLRRAARRLAISSHTLSAFNAANPALDHGGAEVVHPFTPRLSGRIARTALQPGFALIVGRMSAEERYKGHDQLIDVWPTVRACVPDARLLCVGGGDDLPRLRARVASAGLDEAITFTGPVPASELSGWYRQSAFFVLPSTGEGFGLVFLEAMAAGRACIGAPGSAAEIIVPGETGLIANPAEPGDLAESIITLYADRARRDGLGSAGCVRAGTVFHRDRFVRQLGRVLAPYLPC